jgi:retron-type reverse transcriptase
VYPVEYIDQRHKWVVDMDLEKFFDKVNHDILIDYQEE